MTTKNKANPKIHDFNGEKVTERQNEILTQIQARNELDKVRPTRREMALYCDISEHSIDFQVKKLRKMGLLTESGPLQIKSYDWDEEY